MSTETYFGSTIVSGFTPVVQFQMNGRSNTDSNYFLNATVQISVATNPQAVAACQNTVSDRSSQGDIELDGSHTQSTTYISGVSFNEVDGSDTLTGNGIGLRALSAVHNGACYRIDIIMSGDYLDVTPTVDRQTALSGATKNGLPFNAYDAYAQMNSVAQSFKFINPSAPVTSMSNISCSVFSSLQKGDTDSTTGGEVSQIQSFLGMSNVTGYYGAQTSIAYTNNTATWAIRSRHRCRA